MLPVSNVQGSTSSARTATRFPAGVASIMRLLWIAALIALLDHSLAATESVLVGWIIG